MREVLFIHNKPYYFHKFVLYYNDIHSIKKKNPKLHYYWVKIWDTKKKTGGYAVYTDRKLI